MDSDWALVEYRRGRYAKVTPDGTVLGKATDDEVKAWFAAHGWRVGRPSSPEQEPVPNSGAGAAAAAGSAETGVGPAGGGLQPSENVFGPADQPTLPAFDRETGSTATPPQETESGVQAPALDAEPGPRLTDAPTLESEPAATGLETDTPPVENPVGVPVLADDEPAVSQPADVKPQLTIPEVSDGDSLEPDTRTPVAGVQDPLSEEREAWTGDQPVTVTDERTVSGSPKPLPDPEPGQTGSAAVPPAVLPLSAPVEAPPPVEPALSEADATDRWLWVDPRQERGYSPAAFDVAAFLDRAVDLFRSKPWSGGQKPRRLAVHPSGVAEMLETAAEDRALELVADPKVAAGTYMLALADREVDA